MLKEECSIESHFCIKDDAMWVYVPKDEKEKTRKKSKWTIMWSIQFDNNNILEVMNFQKYIKIYMKSSYCKDTPSKHMRRQKRKLKKHPIFSSSKDSICHEVNGFIMNLYLGHHLYVYIYINTSTRTFIKYLSLFKTWEFLHDCCCCCLTF